MHAPDAIELALLLVGRRVFGCCCCWSREVEDLNRELKEMRALVEELHSALRAEQAEKTNLQVKPSSRNLQHGWAGRLEFPWGSIAALMNESIPPLRHVSLGTLRSRDVFLLLLLPSPCLPPSVSTLTGSATTIIRTRLRRATVSPVNSP